MRLVTPENDHIPLVDLAPGPRPAVSVVIPVYNRVDLLARTVAGLAGQSGISVDDLDVVVVDDGSTDDVQTALDDLPLPFSPTVLRQHRDGYGAGRARNRGAEVATGDVILFLDADCLPASDLVLRHAELHARAENLVVIGERRYADTTTVTTDDLLRGRGEIDEIADVSDWRSRLYRLTFDLAHGNEAFRAFLSGNASVRRTDFLAVGGFDESFTRWGGEDTELGWRLFNAGLVFVPTPAVIHHQVQQDEGPDGWREEDRAANEQRLVDRIPHRFYRKDTTVRHLVPKVSVVVAPAAGPRSSELLDQLRRQRLADWEVFFPLDTVEGPEVQTLPDTAGTDEQRVLRAIARSRGEYVAIMSGRAAPGPRFLDHLVGRLDDAPRLSSGSSGLVDRDGRRAEPSPEMANLPSAVVTRRREWAKALPDAANLTKAWHRVDELAGHLGSTGNLVTIDPDQPSPATLRPHVPAGTVVAEVNRRGGFVRRWIYHLATFLRRRRRPSGPNVLHLGDERSQTTVARTLPWATVVPVNRRPAAAVVGGGTKLEDSIVDVLRTIDSPRTERVVAGATIGPGAGEKTARLLATCLAVGVATEEDVARVRELDPSIPVAAVGHPADGGAQAIFDALTREIGP